MIPFNPLATHVLWYQAWRKHVRAAKDHPESSECYGRAALIAQAEYVMSLALELNKAKR